MSERTDEWTQAVPGGVAAVAGWRTADRDWLATAGTDGAIHTWRECDARFEKVCSFGHNTSVWTINVWAADDESTVLASAGDDGAVRVWDPETGQLVFPPLSANPTWTLTIDSWLAPDGDRIVAAAGFDGLIRLWSLKLQAVIAQFEKPPDDKGAIWSLTSWNAADGRRKIASAGFNGRIHVWDVGTGRLDGPPLLGHIGGVTAITHLAGLGAGGGDLASAGFDGTIRLWDTVRRTESQRAEGEHAGAVWALDTWLTSNSEVRIASAGSDSVIRIWSGALGDPIERLRGHTDLIRSLQHWTTPAGVLLSSGSYDGSARVWNTLDGRAFSEPTIGHVSTLRALKTWRDIDGNLGVAAAGDDGFIRSWDSRYGTQKGAAFKAHAAAIRVLETWRGPDDSPRVASAGDDTTIRVWNPGDGQELGRPMVHGSLVRSLVRSVNYKGLDVLYSGADDGTICTWDLDEAVLLGDRVDGHSGTVRAMARSELDGRELLISAGGDGWIRLWHTEPCLTPVKEFKGHDGQITSLATYLHDSGPRLVSVGVDGAIKVWTLRNDQQVAHAEIAHSGPILAVEVYSAADGSTRCVTAGEDSFLRTWRVDPELSLVNELPGHERAVRDLVAWTDPSGGARLASCGYDGTLRMWNPESGRAIRVISAGMIALWGFSDTPAREDLLDRVALAKAIAAQLCRPLDPSEALDSGPTVISIEGPWGSGKTTLMELVREQLPAPPDPAPGVVLPEPLLTVQRAFSMLRQEAADERNDVPAINTGSVLAIWFNPWSQQSGDQLWVGLTRAIVQGAAAVLYRNAQQRDWYWFKENVGRVDRHATRRILQRRVVSPIFGIALLLAVLQLGASVARLDTTLNLGLLHINAPTAVLVATAIVLIIGAVHTGWRYLRAPASRFLPGSLFDGPIQHVVNVADSHGNPIVDPFRFQKDASLALYQTDVSKLLRAASDAGYTTIVFIDDLDRCSSETVGEVLQAINTFLSGSSTLDSFRARFVIGMDPAIVSGQIDDLYSTGHDAWVGATSDDPSRGWSFLRKLIQLPVLVPILSDGKIRQFIESATPGGGERPLQDSSAQALASGARRRAAAPFAATRHLVGTQQPNEMTGLDADIRAPLSTGRSPVETITAMTLDQHPDVKAFLADRLQKQPRATLRDGKRILNVWQLYTRMLSLNHPLQDAEEDIARAKTVALLSEVICRWPSLHQRWSHMNDGILGIEVLCKSAPDRAKWNWALRELGIQVSDAAASDFQKILLLPEASGIGALARRLLA